MQAVHWIAGCGLYDQEPGHGPKWGPTTVAIAQEIAALTECRPSIDYLARKLGVSERTVQYHLAHLRAAGLLVYRSKGTRLAGRVRLASVYERVIPAQFDQALGIRTVLRDETAPTYTRTAVGIAEAGRSVIGDLARKATRKIRKKRTKQGVYKPVDSKARCTPMEGGSSTSSSAAGTYPPPESKLASGQSESDTKRRSRAKTGGRKTKGRRKLNVIGRRYQLGRELTQQVEWLRGCSVPRIAWVARELADAGWTVTEVLAWLHLRGTAQRVHRSSGLLAVLLTNAENVLDTPAKRADAVAQWRGAQEAQRRHDIERVRAERERYEGDWHTPASRAVRSEVDGAVARLKSFSRPVVQDLPDDASGPGAAVYKVGDSEFEGMRAAALAELEAGVTSLITDTIHGCGYDEALRVYGSELMDRARRIDQFRRSSVTSLNFGA
ncbi:helix-turn-helix domain-containing protein [Streptomyces sp. WAC08241]|nr:helix-turn-helix domain-containing protein [Streptomyces sp. WAC08241]